VDGIGNRDLGNTRLVVIRSVRAGRPGLYRPLSGRLQASRSDGWRTVLSLPHLLSVIIIWLSLVDIQWP
jgi:hypothetical protein